MHVEKQTLNIIVPMVFNAIVIKIKIGRNAIQSIQIHFIL